MVDDDEYKAVGDAIKGILEALKPKNQKPVK
jgi:hypothetical protein